MNRFYIKEIAASGADVQYSSIVFEPGVNILHGPSNTGKSYVIACIDFMFAATDAPFTRSSTGYDLIHMVLESADGGRVAMQRKIVDGTGKKIGKDVGEKSVEITESNVEGIDIGTYDISKFEYSDALLRLIGVGEHHKIVGTQKLKSKNLTNRTFWHAFFLNEEYIYQKATAYDVPAHPVITATLMALNFLFTGDDLNYLLPEKSDEERKLSEARRSAVISYIDEKMQLLADEKAKILEEMSAFSGINFDKKIDETIEQLAELENEMDVASSHSRQVMQEIYQLSKELEESQFLLSRYKVLKNQYNSDVKRLKFIIDGDEKIGKRSKVSRCPFCETELSEEFKNNEEYAASSRAELERVLIQLNDLKAVEKDLKNDISAFQKQLSQLHERNREITSEISEWLSPKAKALKKQLDDYKQMVRIRKYVEAIDTITEGLDADVKEKEGEKEEKVPEIDAMDYFDESSWEDWNRCFSRAIESCAYPNFLNARLSKETYDAIINGKHKSDEGKGYRAFINCIILFSLMKALENVGVYRPAMLILDSPILTLKEKKNIMPEELADPGMRESLFQYFMDNCGDNQIIIAENEIPQTVNMNYEKAHMIEFTFDEYEGRFGFLRTIPKGNA